MSKCQCECGCTSEGLTMLTPMPGGLREICPSCTLGSHPVSTPKEPTCPTCGSRVHGITVGVGPVTCPDLWHTQEMKDVVARLRTERDEAVAALRAFLVKYDLLKPAMDGAFAFQANHGFPYEGETWESEIETLRALARLSTPKPFDDSLYDGTTPATSLTESEFIALSTPKEPA